MYALSCTSKRVLKNIMMTTGIEYILIINQLLDHYVFMKY